MDKCVHCGFCLPACPTYVLWGEEMDSPRGRIWLMRKAATAKPRSTDIFQTHIDNCLGCMACMTACPSGVEYNKLIEDTRGQVERQSERTGSRSLSDRLFRKLLFATFPHPTPSARTRLSHCAIYQRSGLQTLVRASGLLKLSPERLRCHGSSAPTSPAQPVPLTARAPSAPPTNRAAASACSPAACRTPSSRTSTPPPHASSPPKASKSSSPDRNPAAAHSWSTPVSTPPPPTYAKTMIATFDAANVDTIVINAAGCGSTMKEYAHLLRDDPAWSARAAAFSAKCKDISEVLSAVEPLGFIAPRRPIPLRVAYHDACHLRHAQGIFAAAARAPRADSRARSSKRSPKPNLCCGSAGVYNLLNPEPANELGDRKVSHLLATGADAVISANPGCLLQLMNGLRRRGVAELPTFHMVELLDASIRGLTVDQLLHGPRSLDIT